MCNVYRIEKPENVIPLVVIVIASEDAGHTSFKRVRDNLE